MVNYKTGPGNYKSSYFISVIKQEDEIVSNSSTMQDDDELKLDLLANRIYMVVIHLLTVVGTVPDFKSRLSIPTGATALKLDSVWRSNSFQSTLDWETDDFVQGVSGTTAYTMWGRVIMGSTEGEIVLQWAQNTPTVEDTKILKGSTMVAHVS